MKKRFSQAAYSLSTVIAVTLFMLILVRPAAASPSLIGPSSQSQACQGITLDEAGTSATSNACTTDTSSGLDNLLTTVIDVLSLIAGIISIIMIIVGGFKYTTSGGDSAKTGSAKNTIIYALVGLVIVVFAQALVHFVLHKSGCATGTETASQCTSG